MKIPEKLTPLQTHLMIKNGDGVIVDVRELAEYLEGHVEGSIHIPLSEIQHKMHMLSDLKYDNIIMLCTIGRRSFRACQIALEEQIPKTVYNLDGGINSWIQNHLPIIK